MNDFIISIFGNYSIGQILALIFFFLIGLALYSLQEVRERNVQSKSTPIPFSFVFFIMDNAKRFLLVFILIFIQFRFFKELTGQELTEFTAFLIGYAGNGIGGFSKRNIKLLQANRDKLINDKP